MTTQQWVHLPPKKVQELSIGPKINVFVGTRPNLDLVAEISEKLLRYFCPDLGKRLDQQGAKTAVLKHCDRRAVGWVLRWMTAGGTDRLVRHFGVNEPCADVFEVLLQRYQAADELCTTQACYEVVGAIRKELVRKEMSYEQIKWARDHFGTGTSIRKMVDYFHWKIKTASQDPRALSRTSGSMKDLGSAQSQIVQQPEQPLTDQGKPRTPAVPVSKDPRETSDSSISMNQLGQAHPRDVRRPQDVSSGQRKSRSLLDCTKTLKPNSHGQKQIASLQTQLSGIDNRTKAEQHKAPEFFSTRLEKNVILTITGDGKLERKK